MRSNSSTELWDAYRNTSFLVDAPSGRFRIRIGEISKELDQVLDSAGVDSWAYITAFNPSSIPLPNADNQARQARLRAEISIAGYDFMEGQGIGAGGRWPAEKSILILGIARDSAIELGRGYGQAAIVVGLKGGSAELVRC